MHSSHFSETVCGGRPMVLAQAAGSRRHCRFFGCGTTSEPSSAVEARVLAASDSTFAAWRVDAGKDKLYIYLYI